MCVAAAMKTRIEPVGQRPEGCSEEIRNCKPFISASDFNYVILKYRRDLSTEMKECLIRARDELQNHPAKTWRSAEVFVQGTTKAFKFISGKRSNVFVCYKPRIGLTEEASDAASTSRPRDVGCNEANDAAIIYREQGAGINSHGIDLFKLL